MVVIITVTVEHSRVVRPAFLVKNKKINTVVKTDNPVGRALAIILNKNCNIIQIPFSTVFPGGHFSYSRPNFWAIYAIM